MKKLIICLLLVFGCDGPLPLLNPLGETNKAKPILSLTGMLKNLFTYYTNTKMSKIDTVEYVYPEYPWIFDLDSDSTWTYGYYDEHSSIDENGIQTNFCSENIQTYNPSNMDSINS